MKIGIIGYGKMGKMIESITLNRGHTIGFRSDAVAGVGDIQQVTPADLQTVDAAIEFALPEGTEANIRAYAQSKTPVVIGTTGWTDRLPAFQKIIQSGGGTLVYGSNFSVGAHLLFRLAENAAAMVNKIEAYDMMIQEFHHKQKRDSPSGTALTLAEKVMAHCSRKTTVQTEPLNRAIRPEELCVRAVRGGSFPGIHSLILDSDADTIEITHTARSRGGFALGAVLAAEWLILQSPGFYPVDAFMDSLLQTKH